LSSAPRFEIASFGPGNAAKIARDQFNLALGGIRLAEIEVPTAENVNDNVGRGYMLDSDAEATVDAAKASSVGMP